VSKNKIGHNSSHYLGKYYQSLLIFWQKCYLEFVKLKAGFLSHLKRLTFLQYATKHRSTESVDILQCRRHFSSHRVDGATWRIT